MMPNYMPVSAPHPPPAPPVHTSGHPGQSAPWTTEEDSTLIDAKSSGMGWNEIHQKCFPTKSGNACRKRHERLMIKLRTTDWDHNRIQRVMMEYNRPHMREDFWGRIANAVGERWEDVEKVVCQQYSQTNTQLTKGSASNKASRD
jgi:Myb-like DNA-binding domain